MGWPDHGAHDGVTMEAYHAFDAASHSRLEDMRRSPAYMKFRIDNPDREETPYTLRGSAIHCLLFEPDAFASRYCLAQPCSALLKSGDRKGEPCGAWASVVFQGAWFCGKHFKGPGDAHAATPLPVDAWDAAHRSADAVRLDETAKVILDRCPHRERSVAWQERGVLVKGRPDAYGDSDILDLKSTCDALDGDFPRFAARTGVLRQLALYRGGIESFDADGSAVRRAYAIAVMPDQPHEVRTYRAPEHVLEDADATNGMLLARYGECVRTGRYPCDSGGEIVLALPRWETAKMEVDVVL